MCIIYRMGNDCLCWLFLVTVDIIRDWLPQGTELLFGAGVELGRCTVPNCVLSWPYGKITIIWGPFYGFKSKRLFRINLMHGNTDNISHVPILTWPCMTSSLTSHGSVNDITRHFSWNSFLMLSFDTKMSHLKRRWQVLRANQYQGNLLFTSINVSFRKAVPLKKIPWILPHPNFFKNTMTFDVSNGVNVCSSGTLRTSRISSFTVISGSAISPPSVAKFFGECNWKSHVSRIFFMMNPAIRALQSLLSAVNTKDISAEVFYNIYR